MHQNLKNGIAAQGYDVVSFFNGSPKKGNFSSGIYCHDGIVCRVLVVFSDARIKEIRGRSDTNNDFQTLLGIEITDFSYKDTIAHGNAMHKKVIAQQVEKIFPQAISYNIDVIPDIYQLATHNDGWIEVSTNLKKRDRVKLINDDEEGIYEVLEVREDKFRTEFKSEKDKVFVYGREVDDFRTVDYEAISMLNVSATQEIAKQMEALKAENKQLKEAQEEMKKDMADFKEMLRRKGLNN